jgi:hypothetical protein
MKCGSADPLPLVPSARGLPLPPPPSSRSLSGTLTERVGSAAVAPCTSPRGVHPSVDAWTGLPRLSPSYSLGHDRWRVGGYRLIVDCSTGSAERVWLTCGDTH